MKILLLAAGLALTSFYTINIENNNSNPGGWQKLFDGKTTAGWHSYGKTVAEPRWKVTDGALSIDTTIKEGDDLVTNNSYENFDLKFEWKISKNGNSGVIFLVQEDPAVYKHTYNSGPEMQVLDNDGHPDGKITKHRAGDLYDLIKSTSEPVKAVGEWNQAEIIVNKGKLELKLNGVTTVSTTLWGDEWKKLVAGSKFKDMPNWGTFTSGKNCIAGSWQCGLVQEYNDKETLTRISANGS